MSEKDTDGTGTGEPSNGQMAAKIIPLVSDSNDSKFEQERVPVFTGAEIGIQVTLRPPSERGAHLFPPLLEGREAA